MNTLPLCGNGFRSLGKMALLGLVLLTAACKKDPDAVSPDGGNGGGATLACVGKNLRLTSLVMSPAQDFDGDGKVDAELLPFMDACARDNTITFERNGKLTGSEGPTKCPDNGTHNGDPTHVGSSTWKYDAKANVLTITTGPNDVAEWNVVSVSANSLKARIAGDDNESLTMTWQAQ